MALPGMRGYGRDDNWAGGRNSSYGRNKSSFDNGGGFSGGRLKTAGTSSDPALGRRVEGLEQRLGNQDSANRNILEQMMKLQQDFKMQMKKQEQAVAEERNQRMRMESVINGAVNKLSEVEERLRRAEDSGKENKSALSQLISHTQNVERAVIAGQQDMVAKKEQQGKKIQELYHKMASVQSNRETLERTCYNLRDEVKELDGKVENFGMEVKDFEGAVKMQGAMMDKLASSRSHHGEKEGKEKKMTETQRAMLEAKIMQCQQTTLDLGAKLAAEKRDRDQDFDQVNSRITEVVADLAERERTREGESREAEARSREQAGVGNAEKQKIIMQISAVQSDIKRTLEERETKMREMTVHKLEEIDSKLVAAEKSRVQADRDTRTFVEAELEKQKVYVEHGVEGVRKMQEAEGEQGRGRISELAETLNQMEANIAEVKSTLLDDIQKIMQEGDSREKILEAKIEDQGDKLRLGLGTLQSAIGEAKQGGGVPGEADLDEIEKMQEEAMAGVREQLMTEITGLEEQIGEMKTDIRRQEEVIEARLKSSAQSKEDATNILGDKLHQKMDSIAFTQERMKRQMEALQERVSGAPSDIGDIRDRMEDLERDVSKKVSNVGGGAASGDVESMRKDLDKILGRDEHGTAQVEGIPTLARLQTDVDQLNSNMKTVSTAVEELRDTVNEKIGEEKTAREEETSSLKKDLERLEKKSKELKERIKGKLGAIPGLGDDDNQDDEEGNE